jgi:predicted nucleic acid-binding protein
VGAVVVLDASIVIGVLEAEDAHHQAATAAVDEHADDDLRLPASAYAEVLVEPAKRGFLLEAQAKVGLLPLRIDPIERGAGEAAAVLRAQTTALRLPDALVLGHAEAIDADVVLTTDRRWRRVSPRVKVVG